MKRLVILMLLMGLCMPAAAEGRCRTHELPEIPVPALSVRDTGIRSMSIKEAKSVGDTESFWINEQDTWFEINAVIRNITSVAYVYVQTKDQAGNAVWVDTAPDAGKLPGYITQDDVNQVAAEFDSIYVNDRLYFGEEEPEGVDGDSMITILLTDIDESYANSYTGGGYIAGYFWSMNEYTEAYASYWGYHSNERKMFYIDTFPLIEKGSYPGTGDVNYTPTSDHDDFYSIDEGVNNSYSTLAHEFQHMIHWYHDADEEAWVDEGCAVYAEYINGYGHATSDINDFASNYGQSLTNWGGNIYDYGKSYLFMLYISNHYGGNLTITEIVSETDIGITGINHALSTRGYSETFTKIFNDWTIANVLDDTTIGDGLYGYLDLDFTVPVVNAFSSYPTSALSTVNYWAAEYINFTGGDGSTLNLSFYGANDGNFNVSVAKLTASSKAVEYMPLDSIQNGELFVNGFGSTYDDAVLIISNDESSGSALYMFAVEQMSSTTTSTTSTSTTSTSTTTTLAAGEASCTSCNDCTSKLDGSYETVYLTADISTSATCVEFSADNMEFDCRSHSIQGPYVSDTYGIFLQGNSNNTVKNCEVSLFDHGIYLNYSDSNTVTGNTLENNTIGLVVYRSDDNTLTDNLASNNSCDLTCYGVLLTNSSSNVFSNNTITNNYLGVYLYFANDSTVTGNTMSHNDIYGIFLAYANNNTIGQNQVNNNTYDGILPLYSHNNYLTDNTADYNGRYGIYLLSSNYSTLNSNQVCSNVISDLYLSSALGGSGDENICDEAGTWSDTGTTGCTYDCTAATTTTTSTTSTTTSTSTSTSTTTTVAGECTLVGDEAPCNTVTLSEVIDLINLWAGDGATLANVIDLINAWAGGASTTTTTAPATTTTTALATTSTTTTASATTTLDHTLASWTDSTIDTWSTSSCGRYADLAIDSNDDIHVVHYINAYSTYTDGVYYMVNSDGSWSERELVYADQTNPYTRIAVDSNGGVHIAYPTFTGYNLGYAYKAAGAGSFSTETVASSATNNLGQYTSMDIDENDVVYIAYLDRTSYDLLLASKPAGSGSWTIETVDTSVTSADTSIVVANGVIHIAFVDSNSFLKYIYRATDSSTWSEELVDSSDTMQYPSIAVDSSGTPHIAYHARYSGDGDDGALMFSSRIGSGAWSASPDMIDDSLRAGLYTSLAFDSNDNILIAYHRKAMSATYLDSYMKVAVKNSGDTSWTTRTIQYGGNSDDEQIGTYAELAVDSTDKAHVVYRQEYGGRLRYAVEG